jgi:hypothetical protein
MNRLGADTVAEQGQKALPLYTHDEYLTWAQHQQVCFNRPQCFQSGCCPGGANAEQAQVQLLLPAYEYMADTVQKGIMAVMQVWHQGCLLAGASMLCGLRFQ